MVTIEQVHTIHPSEATPEVLDALEERIQHERAKGKVTCAIRHWERGGEFVYVEIHDKAAQRRQAVEAERVRKGTMIRVEKK